ETEIGSARLGARILRVRLGSRQQGGAARLAVQAARRGLWCRPARLVAWDGRARARLATRSGRARAWSGFGFGRAGADRFRVRASAETWVRLRRLEARAADRLRVAAAGDGCARIEAAPFGFDRSGAAGWLRLSRRVPAALRRIYAARRGWLRIRRSAARMRSGSGFGLQTRRGWDGGSALLRPAPRVIFAAGGGGVRWRAAACGGVR
uniref:Uncharacterized protein n=1 Tax=Cucumis melo TaxID=3656 RepID=A0A9I9CCM7_CUCME